MASCGPAAAPAKICCGRPRDYCRVIDIIMEKAGLACLVDMLMPVPKMMLIDDDDADDDDLRDSPTHHSHPPISSLSSPYPPSNHQWVEKV